MQQKAFDVHLLIKWIVLNGLLWPVGFILYASFVDILIDGIGRLGFYAACPRMYGIPSPTILLTSNACLQGWFAFHFCWTGMIVGAMVGFTQWRFVFRPITIPDTWITINTISWAIGGPLAYLSYRLFLHDLGSQLALRSLQAIPEMTIFTWVILLSEAISCFGEQWLLGKQGPKSTHWVLSSLLGIASAGCVHLLIGQWIPVIVYGGLFVGVTSGFALLHQIKHNRGLLQG